MSTLKQDEAQGYKGIVWGVAILLVILAIANWPTEPGRQQVIAPTAEQVHADSVAAAEKLAESIVRNGQVMAKVAIKMDAKDPESVKFFEKIAEQYYPETGVYWGKWRVTATNSFGGRVQGIAVGSAKYKGGDPTQYESWEIVNGEIESL